MIDLHIHLLPGIDDGPADLAEAVEMCRGAAADGCEILVATPHQRHERWWNTDPDGLESLRRLVQRAVGPTPEIRLGAEIHVDSALLDGLDAMPRSGLVPLAGSRYLLLELDREGLGPAPEHLVHEITVAGWKAVIAHPELLPGLRRDAAAVRELVAAGALMQVTAMSVTGEFGARVERFTRELLDAGLIHVLASDAHGVGRRPPGLRRAHEAVTTTWGREVADRLTRGNPAAVLADRPLEP